MIALMARTRPLDRSLFTLGLLATLALPVGASACTQRTDAAVEPTASTAATAAADREEGWETTGTIRRIEADRHSITIQHADVPGYMPSMTMPFDVEDPSLFEGLSVGDTVRFRFVRTEDGRHVIRAIHRT